VAVGIVNAFIPLLPTTVFLLIGAWAWGKGAPEWRARLLAHPRWGEPLRLWANGQQMTRQGKRLATLGIATSGVITVAWIGPTPAVLAVGLGLAALVAWLWWRPSLAPSRPAATSPRGAWTLIEVIPQERVCCVDVQRGLDCDVTQHATERCPARAPPRRLPQTRLTVDQQPERSKSCSQLKGHT